MAHFRGTVEGNRSEASRLGHKSSGLTVEAASWEGKVTVRLWYDAGREQDMATVELNPHHGKGTSRMLYCGPVSGMREPFAGDVQRAGVTA